MKLSDELLLKSLRANVLSAVAEDHWDLVCKAVDDAGDIREVRGYARTVIFDAIEKFNPYHDELGQFTSGGAGGASAGSARGGSLTASDLQGLDNENASILQSSMQHEDNTEAFRMSNPYRANNAKVLLANLVAAQKWSEEHKQYTGKLYSEIAKEPFLDTTDIEPDMGGGASRSMGVDSPKITTSRGVPLKDANLSEISATIRRDIKSQGKEVHYAAKPYLDALDTMGDIKDNYYEDSGTSVVAYLLGNLTTYKGETARAIKAELNARLKAERKK